MTQIRKTMRVLIAMALLFAMLGWSGAQQQAHAIETRVTNGGDSNVATNAVGDSVVLSNSGSDVYAQRYNSSGMAQGDRFRVNTTTVGLQYEAVVDIDVAGNFVVVWLSTQNDNRSYDVYAQRYNSSGIAQGGEFRVNTTRVTDFSSPGVAVDDAGNFVIVWQSDAQSGNLDIYARRYNSSGVAQGDEFRVNTTVFDAQYYVSVAANASGDFVITWCSTNHVNRYDVYAQRYNSSGIAQGGEFRVNTTPANSISVSSVALDAAGNFVIAWARYQSGDANIYARRYNSSGIAQGDEFRVNSTTVDSEVQSDVSMDASGNFVVTWQHTPSGTYGDFDIYGQCYGSDGIAKGKQFRINTTTAGDQSSSSVALDDAGRFIVTWTSNQSGNSEIYADRFAFIFNNAPVAKNQSESILEDTSIAIDLSAFDKDKDALTYSIVSQPTRGTLSGSGTRFTYTPAANYNGADSFTYKANDGTSDSNIAKISLAIASVNDAPVAKSQSTSLRTNSSVYITLLASDVDNANLTYNIVSPPASGTLTGNGNIRLYKPTPGYEGDDSFTFSVSDGSLTSNTAKASITVRPNMAPIADSQVIALKEDTPTPFTLSAKDGDDNTLLYTVLTQPTRGTLTGSGQSFTYTPNANISGSDSFTFKVSDGNRDSNVAKITFAVQAVNDAPVAQSQSVSTEINRTVYITLRASDVDNGGLTYSIVAQPQHGTLVGSGASYRYTPAAGYSGSDSFSFTANDGNIDSNTATVNISVAP